jgi:hypothetical protein
MMGTKSHVFRHEEKEGLKFNTYCKKLHQATPYKCDLFLVVQGHILETVFSFIVYMKYWVNKFSGLC